MGTQSSAEPLGTGHRKALAWLTTGPKKLLIGGKWVEAISGRSFETTDPATESVLAEVAEAAREDVDAAVMAARRALEAPSWAGASPHMRTRALLKIADLIDANADELAALETLDNGAPLSATTTWVASIARTFGYYAGWPTKILGTTNPTEPTRFIYMLREPMGVCGLINPWNAPLTMAANKIAPALACGNTFVLKPAEQTPLTALRLGELILEADLPPGVVNILPGFGASAGAAMANHPDIDKIAFTGSTFVGKEIPRAAAVNIKKVTLELGGKSPNIIFPDADIDAAVTASVSGFCRNSGQICSAGTRLFVHESRQDEIAAMVAKAAGAYKVGAPFAADTQLGPLISGKQMERVLSYVEAGRQEGARLDLGGARVGERGYFVPPTMFSHVGNRMKIAQEEIYGLYCPSSRSRTKATPFRGQRYAIWPGGRGLDA